MRITMAFMTFFFGLVVSTSDKAPKVHTFVTVTFPINGQVQVVGTVKQGEHPKLSFRSIQTGQLLLNVPMGNGDDWKELTDASDSNYLDMVLGFLVLHEKGLPDPLIVTVARRAGGSDCAYSPALFGEFNGKISQLTPNLPDFLTRGGILLTELSKDSPAILTIESERYQRDDVHYMGPSRMAIYSYRYSADQGKFVLNTKKEVAISRLLVPGKDIMSLFGEFTQC
jgi:hypothetical protein